jgi:hypothetical protein
MMECAMPARCCSLWDPYQQNDIHRLEMVQRRAGRYVTNRYHNTSSDSSMIEQLEWTILQERRKHSRLLIKNLNILRRNKVKFIYSANKNSVI